MKCKVEVLFNFVLLCKRTIFLDCLHSQLIVSIGFASFMNEMKYLSNFVPLEQKINRYHRNKEKHDSNGQTFI